LDIQAELNNAVELVAPHRVFIRRGPLHKECRAHDELYEFLLFNDKLLYAAETPLGLKLHRDMPIDEHFAINDVPPQDNHHKFEVSFCLLQISVFYVGWLYSRLCRILF
jgi:hypothetical protein